MPDHKIKIAIIGCGMIADFHVAALQTIEGAEICGVYDTSENKRNAFGKKYCLNVFSSKDEIWKSDCDLVAICTPSGTHASFAVAALGAGKNVAVEKPLALTYADCLKVAEAAKGKICAPISQLRFSDSVLAAKRMIDDGRLGRITLINLSMKYFRDESYYAGSWRGTFAMDGGGALMNQGIHGIDIMRFLGGKVKGVQGIVRTLTHNIEVEDTAVANVIFESGALGTIDAATSVKPGYPRRLEICGDKGSIIMEEDSIVKADVEGFSIGENKISVAAHSDPSAISAEGHRRQYENIVSAMRGEKQLAYTVADAAETVKLITSIYNSSRKGMYVEL